ncbi:hypothetical protein KC19_6G147100 [Ceratodon purpureus]|uniref:Uncharacterized protein n=1 Tax=Ceratodon purpureus TaxID=3225 RepID=A0A8T0HI52_CERPU|nr:hypothetical protein KC19_6G147100 [Ceratodon purpureus]
MPTSHLRIWSVHDRHRQLPGCVSIPVCCTVSSIWRDLLPEACQSLPRL